MNLWYLFGGLFVLILAAPHLVTAIETLPKLIQNLITFVLLLSLLLAMAWAFWFMFTGQVDPSFSNDFIRR